MTQKELILEWIKEHGSILPAKMAGTVYLGQMFGSETSKRCRELRAQNVLKSHQEGKFEVFSISDSKTAKNSNFEPHRAFKSVVEELNYMSEQMRLQKEQKKGMF